MNEIIKAAAEDFYEDYAHPENVDFYKRLTTHFLSHLKANGYEVVRVGDDVRDIIGEELSMFGPDEEHSSSVELTYYSEAIDGINKAYAIGQAQMMKVMEWVGEQGYRRKGDVWVYYVTKGIQDRKTTAQLIEQYQNREV